MNIDLFYRFNVSLLIRKKPFSEDNNCQGDLDDIL